MKHGAIFDMDGLMFDTEKIYRYVWNHLPEEFGLENDPTLGEAVCGTSGAHMTKIVQSYFPELDADTFIRTGLRKVEETVIEEHEKENCSKLDPCNDSRFSGLRLRKRNGSRI